MLILMFFPTNNLKTKTSQVLNNKFTLKYLLCVSNFRMMVSMSVVLGATCPLFTGMLKCCFFSLEGVEIMYPLKESFGSSIKSYDNLLNFYLGFAWS